MKHKSKISNPTIEKLVSEILSQSDPSEIFGKEGIFQEFKRQIVNKREFRITMPKLWLINLLKSLLFQAFKQFDKFCTSIIDIKKCNLCIFSSFYNKI